jgi:hypothetical protein
VTVDRRSLCRYVLFSVSMGIGAYDGIGPRVKQGGLPMPEHVGRREEHRRREIF